MTEPHFILHDGPAPASVRAAVTPRVGGVSSAPYDTFSLAAHVGDDPSAVRANRASLRSALALPAEPLWLKQVHGIAVVDAAQGGGEPGADGAFGTGAGLPRRARREMPGKSLSARPPAAPAPRCRGGVWWRVLHRDRARALFLLPARWRHRPPGRAHLAPGRGDAGRGTGEG